MKVGKIVENLSTHSIPITSDDPVTTFHDTFEVSTFTIITGSVISPFIFLTAATCVVVLCRMKLRKKKPRDVEANRKSKVNSGIKIKGGDFPVVPNCSYAWHNTSRVPVYAYPTVEKQKPRKMVPNKAYGVHTVFPSMKVPVYPNEAYGVRTVFPSLKVPMYPNEAYGVCKGVTHDKEPVYEMVK